MESESTVCKTILPCLKKMSYKFYWRIGYVAEAIGLAGVFPRASKVSVMRPEEEPVTPAAASTDWNADSRLDSGEKQGGGAH
ncbi:unnamed protein product [Spirodela intermedia]|uniref:Uncharacterized protein n=1 Tax=Spirodela intermedia TaxID=51605 RepID=A0A7I8JLU2_SPIIN|nr:unnamed protein product [Spirodela intermedia]CAA6670533.1 unnamed protein product [Spirodela intermedia]